MFNFRDALLVFGSDKENVKIFLKSQDLNYDDDIEYTLIVEDNDKIIGTGSFAGNVLKCIALDDNYQGLALSNKIISHLIEKQNELSRRHLFIFTKPKLKKQMKDYGFELLCEVEDRVALLDNDKNQINNFLFSVKQKIENHSVKNPKKIGCIVMNANPFTLGHKYLTEYAAKNCDLLLVFVVKENKSKFPFNVRYEAVCEGLKDLENVLVLDGGDYIISSATFPSYFLKDTKIINDSYAKLDANIFADYIASALDIRIRFVGKEPLDVVTNNYNENLKEILTKKGVEVVEIDRKESQGKIISASYFRELLEKTDTKLEDLLEIVPKSTLDILKKYNLLNGKNYE